MTESVESDLLYLRHILECIQHVKEDCAGGRTAFDASRTVRDAVLRNLQVMAESTQRLSSRVKADQPNVPWHNNAGFRHRSVHDYVVTDHLPTLELAVNESIAKLDVLWGTGENPR